VAEHVEGTRFGDCLPLPNPLAAHAEAAGQEPDAPLAPVPPEEAPVLSVPPVPPVAPMAPVVAPLAPAALLAPVAPDAPLGLPVAALPRLLVASPPQAASETSAAITVIDKADCSTGVGNLLLATSEQHPCPAAPQAPRGPPPASLRRIRGRVSPRDRCSTRTA
jgi:hypothetical protein